MYALKFGLARAVIYRTGQRERDLDSARLSRGSLNVCMAHKTKKGCLDNAQKEEERWNWQQRSESL